MRSAAPGRRRRSARPAADRVGSQLNPSQLGISRVVVTCGSPTVAPAGHASAMRSSSPATPKLAIGVLAVLAVVLIAGTGRLSSSHSSSHSSRGLLVALSAPQCTPCSGVPTASAAAAGASNGGASPPVKREPAEAPLQPTIDSSPYLSTPVSDEERAATARAAARWAADALSEKTEFPRYWKILPVTVTCPGVLRRIGGRASNGDGGKWLCNTGVLKDIPDCMIYSLGSDGDFSFEEEMLRVAPNCAVHTFDCTLDDRKRAVRRDARIQLHEVCIGAHNMTDDRRRRYDTLPAITASLGHTRIDLLKVGGRDWLCGCVVGPCWLSVRERRAHHPILLGGGAAEPSAADPLPAQRPFESIAPRRLLRLRFRSRSPDGH